MIQSSTSLPNLVFPETKDSPVMSTSVSSADGLGCRNIRRLNDVDTQTERPPLTKRFRNKVAERVRPLLTRIKKLGNCLFPYFSCKKEESYKQEIAAQKNRIDGLNKRLEMQDQDWCQFIEQQLDEKFGPLAEANKPTYLHDILDQQKFEQDMADQAYAALERDICTDSFNDVKPV